MRHRLKAAVPALAALALASLTVGPTPVRAEEPGCGRSAPSEIAAVRGYTWTGKVSSVKPTEPDEHGAERTLITFDVDGVYAHAHGPEFPAGSVLAVGRSFGLLSHSCNGLTDLVEGRNYLISSSEIDKDGPTTHRTVAWEFAGDRAVLVDAMYDNDRPPDPLFRVQSLGEALLFVAPGSELPPTDERSPATQTRLTADLLPVISFLAATFIVVTRFRKTRSYGDLRRQP